MANQKTTWRMRRRWWFAGFGAMIAIVIGIAIPFGWIFFLPVFLLTPFIHDMFSSTVFSLTDATIPGMVLTVTLIILIVLGGLMGIALDIILLRVSRRRSKSATGGKA